VSPQKPNPVIGEGLYSCGDYCDVTGVGYTGSIEGAIRSGLAAADSVLHQPR
jgi:predicted NAD/FAD-dependent oxidoreductase